MRLSTHSLFPGFPRLSGQGSQSLPDKEAEALNDFHQTFARNSDAFHEGDPEAVKAVGESWNDYVHHSDANLSQKIQEERDSGRAVNREPYTPDDPNRF